ncbi:MAG: hypothetical protein U0V48_16655 [Anaerolineales bacterium]
MPCQRGIEPIELISSTSETRAAAGSLSYLLGVSGGSKFGAEVVEGV